MFKRFYFEIIIDPQEVAKIVQRGPSPSAPTITSCVTKVQHQNQETDMGTIHRPDSDSNNGTLVTSGNGSQRRCYQELQHCSEKRFDAHVHGTDEVVVQEISPPFCHLFPGEAPEAGGRLSLTLGYTRSHRERLTGGWGVHHSARRWGCSCPSSRGLSQDLHDVRTAGAGC